MKILAKVFGRGGSPKPQGPVSDEEWRAAYMYFWNDADTQPTPCGDRTPHPAHLWRHVRTEYTPNVDESMKRCGGVLASVFADHPDSREEWRP